MQLQEDSKRTARLEARFTPAVYAMVRRAAEIQGRSLSEFVATASRHEAERAIERQDVVHLSQADQEAFALAMLSPTPINSALDRAAEAHHRLIRSV